MIYELLHPIEISLYTGLFASIGALLGQYICNLPAENKNDWKPIALWGATGALLGSHYVLSRRHYQKRLF